jgi:predicted ester cyclase
LTLVLILDKLSLHNQSLISNKSTSTIPPCRQYGVFSLVGDEWKGSVMNRLLVTLFGALVGFSAMAAEPLSPEKAAQNIELARSFYSLINGGDAEKWKASFAPNWKAHPPLPSAPDQIAGYQQVIGAFRAGVPDLVVKQVEIIANDDVVAVRSKVVGKNTQKLFGQAATNRKMEFTAMDIHRIADGKIVETWHVEDFLSMNKQLSGKSAKPVKR